MNKKYVSRNVLLMVLALFIGFGLMLVSTPHSRAVTLSVTNAGDRMLIGAFEQDRPSNQATGQTGQMEKPAEEIYKNIQVLKGLPASRLLGAMNRFTQFLNVNCDHCHVPAQLEKDDKPAKHTARKMLQMVRLIGKELNTSSVTCYTCHRGNAQPQAPPDSWRAEMDELRKKAGEDTRPAEEVFKNIQALKGVPAGRWTMIMTMFARSLGVNCNHCHVPDAFEKDDKPAKVMARKMLALTGSISREIYHGPTSINCYTCHRGSTQPVSMAPPRQPGQ